MALTGKTRYRPQKTGFFGGGSPLMVLQVEYSYIHDYNCGGYIDSETVVTWRDAKTEDLLELQGLAK